MTDFDRAVEAMKALWPKGNPSTIEAVALLAAAPHLERHFRQKIAADVLADLNAALSEGGRDE